ncbi:MAG TPA: TrbG/VirB9 family P-type conjugative transfer protein [Steroidobacteraceae bacterium]|nr:TrbG/VirB9 family P-type conjugative transfer protein [Steroidobacteraceae bacterium]
MNPQSERTLADRESHRFAGATAFVLGIVLAIVTVPRALANWVPAKGTVDARIRSAPYSADQVYQLNGYVGFETDIEFARDERFLGLAAGDMNALSFKAEGNHLFLKPRLAHVHTNLTVLTSARQYEFEYSASPGPPDPGLGEVIFALKFTYPAEPSAQAVALAARRISKDLAQASSERFKNFDYWFCGNPDLKPIAAWDDGVRTWLKFGARAELPAVFVKGDDGSESLVNFSVQGGDIVVGRVAKRFVLRRGKLTGCIVNRGFTGGGERLSSGTVSPAVHRVTQHPVSDEGVGP